MTFRILTFVLFGVGLFVVASFAYWYMKRRVVETSNLSPLGQKRMAYVLMFFAYFPMVGIPMRFLGGLTSDIFSWVTYSSMGLLAYILIYALIRDGFYWLWHAIKILLHKTDNLENPADALSRRELFQTGYNKALLGLAFTSSTYGVYEARRVADVVSEEVFLKNLPAAFDGLKIAQISDIHVGLTISKGFLEAIVKEVNRLNADVVAITGDLVDGSVAQLLDRVKPLGTIKSTYGSFFCTGNHEYYSGALDWAKALRDMEITVLLNQNQALEKNGQRLYMAGVTDYRAGRFFEDHETSVESAVAGLKEEDCVVLLAHNPNSIHEAAKHKVDLQLSGHTHGGQFFPWNLFVYLAYPYVKGFHHHNNDTSIYVNRGTGYWGPPMRVGVPPEITLLTLRSAKRLNKRL